MSEIPEIFRFYNFTFADTHIYTMETHNGKRTRPKREVKISLQLIYIIMVVKLHVHLVKSTLMLTAYEPHKVYMKY